VTRMRKLQMPKISCPHFSLPEVREVIIAINIAKCKTIDQIIHDRKNILHRLEHLGAFLWLFFAL